MMIMPLQALARRSWGDCRWCRGHTKEETSSYNDSALRQNHRHPKWYGGVAYPHTSYQQAREADSKRVTVTQDMINCSADSDDTSSYDTSRRDTSSRQTSRHEHTDTSRVGTSRVRRSNVTLQNMTLQELTAQDVVHRERVESRYDTSRAQDITLLARAAQE